MKKTAIVYGSTTGNTEAAADAIGELLGITEKIGVETASAEDLAEYEVLIVGTSTWGDGEIQDDWEPLLEQISGLDLHDRKVALFGTGDQNGYPDTFVDGIGILYDAFVSAGATVIGRWPAKGYEHSDSRAVRDGTFVGLALDNDNQSGKTDERIREWVELLKPEIA